MLQTLLIVLPVLSMQAFALALPGPDVVLVLNSALTQSKRYTYIVSIGIAFGLIIHAAYSIYILPHVIDKSMIIIQFIRYLGSAYLIYLSVSSFKAGFNYNKLNAEEKKIESEKNESLFNAFMSGFLCNVLNPKAILFYISVFTVVLSAQTSDLIKNTCAIIMFLMGVVWFSLLAYLFTQTELKTRLEKFDYFYNSLFFITGFVFLLFAIFLLFVKMG